MTEVNILAMSSRILVKVKFILRFSRLWHCAVWQEGNKILEEHAALFMKVEYGGRLFLQNACTFYQTTWCHNSQDHNLNFHCHENVKSQKGTSNYFKKHKNYNHPSINSTANINNRPSISHTYIAHTSELSHKLLQTDSKKTSTSMKEALLEVGSEVCWGLDMSLPYPGSSLPRKSPWLRLLTRDNLELKTIYFHVRKYSSLDT